MTNLKSLPKMAELRKLAKDIKYYPISDLGIIQYAEYGGYGGGLVDFLKLFYRQMIFNSRTEFLNYCSLLERMMTEGRRSPPDLLQDSED